MNQKTELTSKDLADLRAMFTRQSKELHIMNDDDLRDRITKIKEENERVKGNNQRKDDKDERDILLAKLENLYTISKLIKNRGDMKGGSTPPKSIFKEEKRSSQYEVAPETITQQPSQPEVSITSSENLTRVDTNASVINMFYSRTLFLVDGTCSMHYILDKMKSAVATIFGRIHNILQSNGINSDSFQVKFAFYRNYTNYKDSILQYSSWETNSKNICTFMDNISSKGGMNNEAIEIALWYANKERDISQVILIGDAGANTPEEITQRRSIFSEKYWEKAGFQTVGHYQDELIKLKENKIPVYAFYAHESAKKDFEHIASETGGSCEFFLGTSSKGAERLVSLVIEQILRNIGRSNGGNDETLVEIYRKTYCR